MFPPHQRDRRPAQAVSEEAPNRPQAFAKRKGSDVGPRLIPHQGRRRCIDGRRVLDGSADFIVSGRNWTQVREIRVWSTGGASESSMKWYS